MSKICAEKWKDFPIKDIFEVKNTHSIMKKQIKENSGKYPYVTSSEGNNSVVSYISYDITQIEKGNSILIGGKTLIITYQPKDYFSNDSHNLALYLIDETKRTRNIQLFLVTALRASIKHLYFWGDSISKKAIQKDVIFLPTTSGESPDWDYMENYIIEIERIVKTTLKRLQLLENIRTKKIDITKWGKFSVCGKGGIFEIIQPKARKLTEYLNDGIVPFVTSGAFNNGIEKYVEAEEELDKGNCITVSAIGGFSFYQKKDFIGRGGAGSAIKILYKDKLTEKAALFICAVLQKTLSKYDYTTMLSGDKLKKEYIYLPVTQDKKIDWKYMENYINGMYERMSAWV
jgi:hypothetical protein